MSRPWAFERYWREAERPGRPQAEAVPAPAELSGLVATATLLRDHAEAIPAMDVDRAWESLAAHLGGAGMGAVGPIVAGGQPNGSRSGGGTVAVLRPRLGGWSIRVAAAAVAAMVALATVSLRATPGSALYSVRLTAEHVALAVSPHDGKLHLQIAEARLDDLLVSLREGPAQAAPGLARGLVASRAAAVRQRIDVGDLDLRVALDVPPALETAPSWIASAVRRILGFLLPDEHPGSGEVGSPSPVPSQAPPGEIPRSGKGPGGSHHEGSGDEREDGEDKSEDGGSKDHEGSEEDEAPEEPEDPKDEGSGDEEGSGDDEGSEEESEAPEEPEEPEDDGSDESSEIPSDTEPTEGSGEAEGSPEPEV